MGISEIFQGFKIVLNPTILLTENQFSLSTVLSFDAFWRSSQVIYHIIKGSVVELNYTMFLRNRSIFTVEETIVAMWVEAVFKFFFHNFL